MPAAESASAQKGTGMNQLTSPYSTAFPTSVMQVITSLALLSMKLLVGSETLARLLSHPSPIGLFSSHPFLHYHHVICIKQISFFVFPQPTRKLLSGTSELFLQNRCTGKLRISSYISAAQQRLKDPPGTLSHLN